MLVLQLDHVTVRFGATTAVDDVTLGLDAGRVLAVLGPSGCGKSTLLRAVAGLERLDGGRLIWGGRDLAGVPTHRRGFALMFQDGQLFNHASVGDNIGYALRLRGVGRPRRVARVGELLELVGLHGHADRRPATLSGGEQQRVALARALAAEPELLLLDEPLSALDRSLRERLAGDLREILTATGTTAVMVTHDHDEAFTVADRMAVMLGGRVVQEGPTAEVWRAPATLEVAGFIGFETVLQGQAARRVLAAVPGRDDASGGSAAADGSPGGAAVPRAGDGPGGAIPRIGLRRSALRVDRGGPLTGTVRRAVTVSDAVHLEVDVAAVGECSALGEDVATEVGEQVRLAVDPRRLTRLPD